MVKLTDITMLTYYQLWNFLSKRPCCEYIVSIYTSFFTDNNKLRSPKE
ncbi:Uncharacterised protein [Segatella copri]|nr:Uncharacterised protein [Segatella copri]